MAEEASKVEEEVHGLVGVTLGPETHHQSEKGCEVQGPGLDPTEREMDGAEH